MTNYFDIRVKELIEEYYLMNPEKREKVRPEIDPDWQPFVDELNRRM